MHTYDFYSGNPLADPYMTAGSSAISNDPYATAGSSAISNDPYATAGSSAVSNDPYSNPLINPYATSNLQPYGSQGRYSTISGHQGKLGKKSHGINSTSNPYSSRKAPNSLNNASNLNDNW